MKKIIMSLLIVLNSAFFIKVKGETRYVRIVPYSEIMKAQQAKTEDPDNFYNIKGELADFIHYLSIEDRDLIREGVSRTEKIAHIVSLGGSISSEDLKILIDDIVRQLSPQAASFFLNKYVVPRINAMEFARNIVDIVGTTKE